jgi:hypothetical protein
VRISYQDLSPPKGFDMKNSPKPKIRPVDYHLKSGIAIWIPAFRTSGETVEKVPKQILG